MIWLLLFSLRAFAREETLSAIRVIGGEAQELVKPSSSHYISKEKLTKHQDTDMNRIVKQVPGVYVREEDGFGLRPNIGIRGTNPDRSKKVNFMEDGILTGPAPYSAPAAYYTPSMMHVEGVEVFKGVATVPFGPNSVGGSINFLTPEPRGDRHGFVDAAAGTFDYRRILGRVETAGDVYSGLFQGAYHETSGFKELPGNQNTGFEQSDFLAKGRVRLKGGDRPQFLDVKIGFATENSHETYLGISENDFRDGPYQRYQASQLDHMKWRHETYVAAYTVALSANSTLTVNAYNLNFHRNWYRFDGFASGLSVRDVLNDPETYADEYQILKGEVDSDTLGGGGGQLRVVRNRRDFYSRGAEAHHMLSLDRHEIHWGLRVHEDQIRRAHGRDIYGMTGGQMVNSGMDRVTSEKDRDTSWS
nr:TonB-dependent receptor plug domain-containing protein [Bdellovibrionales bacterium]